MRPAATRMKSPRAGCAVSTRTTASGPVKARRIGASEGPPGEDPDPGRLRATVAQHADGDARHLRLARAFLRERGELGEQPAHYASAAMPSFSSVSGSGRPSSSDQPMSR